MIGPDYRKMSAAPKYRFKELYLRKEAINSCFVTCFISSNSLA